MPRRTNMQVSARVRRKGENSEQVGLESLAEAGDSAVLTSAGSSFHHCGARTEKSWDSAEGCLAVFSEGGTSRLAGVVERSAQAGAWSQTNVWT